MNDTVVPEGLETEVWHLPKKVPEIDWNHPKLAPNGKFVDAPEVVTFELDGSVYAVKQGQECQIPSRCAFTMKDLAPQMKKGPAPKDTSAKAKE